MASPTNWVEERINETDKMIQHTKEHKKETEFPEFLFDLELESLQKQKQNLLEEQEEINQTHNHEELEINVSTEGLESGEISVRELNTITYGIQNMADNIAVITSDRRNSSGPIPREILEANELILKETRAGSFIATLSIKHPDQAPLEQPDVAKTMQGFFNLIESSGSENTLHEAISTYGNRTLNAYKDWTKKLKNINSTFNLKWTSSYSEPRSVQIDKSTAAEINESLRKIEEDTIPNYKITGKLTAINFRLKTFEMSEADDQRRINGTLTDEAINDIKINNLSDKNVEALSVKNIIKGPAGNLRTSYELTSIASNE